MTECKKGLKIITKNSMHDFSLVENLYIIYIATPQ